MLLGHPAAAGKERGLERLCWHYERGRRLRNPHPFHGIFIACLYQPIGSVRRWALNAIAAAGTKAAHLQPVLEAIERDRTDEDIFASGIAALVALTGEDESVGLLEKANIPLEGTALLAAAQQADTFRDQLARQRVNIDLASAPELRLAAVLIGLDKAPEHLFDLRHENSAVIGRLDAHPDDLVAQYAVWSINEHPSLNLSHMSSPLRDIEGRPERVRGYTYRLITQTDAVAEAHREYVQLGSEDPSTRARGGLASGLAKAFFEGMDTTTLDWFDSELEPSIKDELLDHIVLFSNRSVLYEGKALDEYDAAGLGTLKRARMRAAAEGLPLYSAFKKRDLMGESLQLFVDTPLFGGSTVTNINAGTINAGIIGDHSKVDGGLSFTQINKVDCVSVELAELMKLLDQAGSESAVQAGRELVAAAQAAPTKDSVGKVLGWMKDLAQGTSYAVAASEGFQKVFAALGEVVDQLPL